MIVSLRKLLFKYWAILFAACALGVALGLFMASRQSRLYVAYGTIEVPGGSVSYEDVQSPNSSGPSQSFLQEAATIKDDQTLNRVIAELHLDAAPSFFQAALPEQPSPEQQAELHNRALSRLRDNLQIQIVGNANLLRLSYESPSPGLAAAIVNQVIEQFADGRFKLRYQSAQQATEFMRPRLDALASQVQHQQLILLQLQRQLGSTGTVSRQNQPDLAFRQLVDSDIRARLDQIAAQVRLSLLSAGAETSPSLTQAPSPQQVPGDATANNSLARPPGSTALESLDSTSQLRLALAAAQQQAAMLSATLGPRHPSLQAVTARVDALESSLDLERRSLLAAAVADDQLANLRESALAEEVQRRNQANMVLAPVVLQHDAEQRDYLFSRALYLRFLWRLRIAAISKAYESADVTVIDQASVYLVRDIKPRWKLIARFLAVMLTLAALLIYRIEALDGSEYKRLEALEGVTGLKILGAVPWNDHLSVPGLIPSLSPADEVSNHQPQSPPPYLQAIFDLRTFLQFRLNQQSAGRTLLFTSAMPSEGKTTLSTSLAVILSRQNRRVLLIDADLRKPSVQRALRLSGRAGLSSILNGKCTLAEAIQHLPDVPTLDVLGSGPIPPETTDLLTSAPMQQLLADASATYDYVIIDSPPVLAVADSLLIAQLVDAVVWVVKDRKIGRAGLLRARSLLENAGAPVVGLAVNSIQLQPDAVEKPSSVWQRGFFQRFRRA